MLRCNINVNHVLVNGAMVVIRNTVWPALHRDQPEVRELSQAVFLEFDDSSITVNRLGIGVRMEHCTNGFDALRVKEKIE
ncbi:unnamed protein product [Parnassius apollo]|uniref:(apollo) hypothetical protein n=1 Tax=Parnassius apollo TaxID=110799 RepID=A0A8S3VY70_PARAO|nr:unnamed protein product [Parnassius apollo]